MTPTPNISSYAPSHHPLAVRDEAEGSVKAYRYEDHGVVKVFAYRGGRHGGPFTVLEMYLCNRKYAWRLPREYAEQWFGRLARQFDWACWQDAKERENT